MICYLYEAPSYLIFAPDLPGLLYYSHIPTTVVALLVGFYVFLKERQALLNQLLFLISLCFSAWITINLIEWTNINSDLMIFLWSFYGILQALISILSVYLMYVFLDPERRDVSFAIKLVFLALLLPVFLFAPTDINVSGFNLAWCDAFNFEGEWYKGYYTFLGVLAVFWILVLLVKRYQIATEAFRKQIVLMGTGIELFLGSFFIILYVATELASLGYLNDSRVEMYGLFGMAIFMVFVSILIVRYRTFNVGMLTAQALVIALVILVGSQFTYVTTTTSGILTSITLVITGFVGVVLIKNVRLEIRQREEIERLAEKLEEANQRLRTLDKLKSEFVSIASHQLRSPLTAIRGYSSMLLEGSFGKFPKKAEGALEKIEQTSAHMAVSIEDYLNVSRIESGSMNYDCTEVNVKELADDVTDDLRKTATSQGLVLSFKSDLDGGGVVYADYNKVEQILHNLLNNALKYTKQGSITVFVHDDINKKKVYVEVIDTGIGMSQETITSLFQKFERAHSDEVSRIKGSGLGLFVARKMAQGMKGDVTAHSEGEGEGSHFILELPLKKKKQKATPTKQNKKNKDSTETGEKKSDT